MLMHSGLGPGNFENWPPSRFVFASMSLKIERKFIAEKQKSKRKLDFLQRYSSLNLSKSPICWWSTCILCPELPELVM